MIKMADVKFDYAGMAEKYKEFTTIVGSAGDSTSIAGILNDTNQDVTDYVDVLDQAIFGDLGKQLKMDWDNFSSDFPKFVEMFDSWAAYVSAAAGDYSKAEADIASFNKEHPLGFASPEGMTQGYVQTGFYSQAYSSEDIQALRDMAQFYELTGATYVDTGMVAFAKRNAWYNGITDTLSLAGAVLGGASIFKGISTYIAAANSSGTIFANADAAALKMASQSVPGGFGWENLATRVGSGSVPWATRAWQTLKINGAFWGTAAKDVFTLPAANIAFKFATRTPGVVGLAGTGAAATVASDFGTLVGATYNPAKYMKGADYLDAWSGYNYRIGSQDYTYIADTPGGKSIYTDNGGNLFQIENGQAIPVTNGSGGTANVTDFDQDNFSITVGDETVTKDTNLTQTPGNHGNGVDYRSYGSSLKGAVDVTGTPTPVEQTTEEVPTEEIPTEEIPTEEVPTEEIPTEEVPTE